MKTIANSIAEELEPLGVADAMAQIAELDQPLAKEVVQRLSQTKRAAITDELRRLLEHRDECVLEERNRAIWLLRNIEGAVASRLTGVLFSLTANEQEPDEVRCLALDTSEHLWLAGVISTEVFRDHLQSLELNRGRSTRTKQRWVRILLDVDADWSLSILKSSYLADSEEDILDALSRSEAPGARYVLLELADLAADESEATQITQALRRYDVRSAAIRLNTEKSTLTKDEFDALMHLNEFALLYIALDQRRLSPEFESRLKGIKAPPGTSKSQRRFCRRIQERIVKK